MFPDYLVRTIVDLASRFGRGRHLAVDLHNRFSYELAGNEQFVHVAQQDRALFIVKKFTGRPKNQSMQWFERLVNLLEEESW